MNIIITMAGLGSRFRNAGYDVPKYMIEVKGKTLFEWAMDSLLDYNPHVSSYFFIVRVEDNAMEFIKEKCPNYGLYNNKVIEIDYTTDGQATTAMLAMPYCQKDESLLIYNIDTYVESGEMKYADLSGDGCIPCFHADGDHWSFVRLNGEGKAVEVVEKKRISDNCTLGAYYFSSADLYSQLYSEYYKAEKSCKEKYIAPLYDYLIKSEGKVMISIVDEKKVHVLGTPEELEVFKKQYA